MWVLWLATALATPDQIGGARPFGIGIAAGFPTSASFKWMPDRRQGIAIHAGPTVVSLGVHLRVQYEQRALELKRWSVANLGLGWHAGALVNLVFGQAAQGSGARVGVFIGPQVELRVVPAPLSVFAEAALVAYPSEFRQDRRFSPVGVTVAIGVRWFFGHRASDRKPEVPAVDAPSPPPPVWIDEDLPPWL
ncbi:MAG TPA: hypothetical protein PKA64_08255 [Myxococcota bacterium]|nr:hypothetical protein [Myxococcota bacterium]